MDFELNRYASFSKFNYLPFLQKKKSENYKNEMASAGIRESEA